MIFWILSFSEHSVLANGNDNSLDNNPDDILDNLTAMNLDFLEQMIKRYGIHRKSILWLERFIFQISIVIPYEILELLQKRFHDIKFYEPTDDNKYQFQPLFKKYFKKCKFWVESKHLPCYN